MQTGLYQLPKKRWYNWKQSWMLLLLQKAQTSSSNQCLYLYLLLSWSSAYLPWELMEQYFFSYHHCLLWSLGLWQSSIMLLHSFPSPHLEVSIAFTSNSKFASSKKLICLQYFWGYGREWTKNSSQRQTSPHVLILLFYLNLKALSYHLPEHPSSPDV